MVSFFFSEAKKREQVKRHLNLVFMQYIVRFVGTPFLENYMHIRSTEGYEKSAIFLENKLIIDNSFINYFKYLENRFKIERNTILEILGMKDTILEIRTPGGYNEEQDFILLIHLYLVSTFDEGFDNSQIDFFNERRQNFNYDAERTNYLINLLAKHIKTYNLFTDFPKLESNVKNDFLAKFNMFPPLSHD